MIEDQNMAWQLMGTAPTDRSFLGYQKTPGDFEGQMQVCWPVKTPSGNFYWMGAGGLMPTHWMPLPAPPVEQAKTKVEG
jgi:hypothetical protein